MAASVPSDKVKDKEYTNWLKVTLALYYMKSGLYTFIQSEVNCLHQSLVQKIYGGQTVPLPPCNICCASCVKRNKFTGVWAFQKRCRSFCDVWLYELLVLHTNPKSEKIYWDNTDIPSWPFNPWQCAKVFMPRGQLLSSTVPAECDAQALLTLLSNCKYFHQKLSPSGQSLTHNISAIRNKVMHNGEMKLSDTDRSNFIQQIIQLLEDPVSLKSTEDCKAAVGNIHKIDNDSVDVFFNVGLELTAMREAVNELRREHGNQEKGTAETIDKLDKLKEEYEQLREKVRKRLEDVEKELSLHENRMDTIERDIKSVKEKTDTVLQQQEKKFQEIHAIVTSEQKQFEDVETKMDTIVRDVQSVKEETESALQQQDKKCQEIHTTFTQLTEILHERVASQDVKMDTIVRDVQSVKEERESVLQQQEKHTQMTEILYERVASQDVRLLAVEENVSKLHFHQRTEKKKSCGKETLRKRKPKTEGMRQLKGTEGQKRRKHCDQDGPKPEIIMLNQEGTNAQKRSLDGDQDGPAPKKIWSNEQETHGSTNNNSVMGEQSTEARKKHNQLCVTLDGLITECPLKSIKRMALTYLDPKTVEKVNDMDHLFSSLEFKGIIGVGKYDKLIEIMADAKVEIGIDEIQKTAKDIKYILQKQFPSQEQSPVSHLDAHTSNKDSINPSPVSETLNKRRPETDGLRQLKGQTEDKLDTIRRLECILTTQAEKAKKLLEEKRYVIIKGNPGEGKTTTALHLIDNEIYTNRRVVVYSPRDWMMVDTDWVDIIVMEDIFGQSDFDPDRLEEWMVYLPTIQEHVDAGKLQVIITTRADILSKAYSMLRSLKLFSDDVSMMLSSKELEKSEKMGILNRELRRYKRNMNEDHREKCTANFDGLIGFPKCCSLFAGDGDLFMKGPTFFKSPEKYFFENITKLKSTAFLSLAFVFCHGKIFEEYLSPKTMPEYTKGLLTQLASCLQISEKKASISLLRDAYDRFLGLYVTKTISWSYIEFSHAIVYEAVGHTLGDRCPEMIVKYGTSEYLYQRTYTAADKDIKSQNVFLPVSVYSRLAERMVGDVIKNKLVKSVVKHSALKESQFVLKLKKELLQNHNGAKEFLMTNASYQFPNQSLDSFQNLTEGCCTTFLEYILQADEDAIKIVHNEFLEFLECEHTNTTDCWKCKEKQILLELTLYYHHFQIADKLISMNACYTHISLCNAARHNDHIRIQTILESLKINKTFRSKCKEGKKALCNAYISGNQSIVDCLRKERITLDSEHIKDVVKQGNMNALLDVVEHLKCHNKWIPHSDTDITYKNISYLDGNVSSEICHSPFSMALHLAYANEKLEMADFLVKNGVKVSMYMLANVLRYSQKTIETLIQHLKDAESWDPKCDVAYETLRNVFKEQKDDVCRLLIQEGVSLSMHSLPDVIFASNKVIQHLKDTGNWCPEDYSASEALQKAFSEENFDVCDQLISDGASLTMSNLPEIMDEYGVSLETAQKVIQHLKDSGEWDPKCVIASESLAFCFCKNNFDVCELLIQNGVSLTMEHFCDLILIDVPNLDAAEDAIKHLKDTGNWNPKCVNASDVLESTLYQGYSSYLTWDLCYLLIQNGFPFAMENLLYFMDVAYGYTFKEIVQDLIDIGIWNPKCDAASEVLVAAFCSYNYDVCDVLIDNGVTLTMENFPIYIENIDVILKTNTKKVIKQLPNVIRSLSELPSEFYKNTIQNLKDTGNWDPKSDVASKALEIAYRKQNYDVCNLLIFEGVSLRMENLLGVISSVSVATVEKAIKHLKDDGSWDPKCGNASEALEKAFCQQNLDTCDLLMQNGISLTMKNLTGVICVCNVSVETVNKAKNNLKDNGNWDPKCDDASEALKKAFCQQKLDVCEQLIHDGISLTMKNLPGIISVSDISLETIEKAIKHLKDAGNWDAKCDDAFEALNKAFCQQSLDVCELLIHDGVSLRMRNLLGIISVSEVSLATVEKAIQNLKHTDNWDPKDTSASQAMHNAFLHQRYDVCNLLICKGISQTMKNLPAVINQCNVSEKTVRRAIQHLKETGSFDPMCDHASEVLKKSFSKQMYEICDMLMRDGVSLTMMNLSDVIKSGSLETAERAIQHLQDTDNWDPTCDDISEALVYAFCNQNYDVCELLIQEGVVLTMKNLPSIKNKESVMKAIHHLKDTGNWDPKCDDASKVLENAYSRKNYDLCNLLLKNGVSIMMKSLPSIIYKALSKPSIVDWFSVITRHLPLTTSIYKSNIILLETIEGAIHNLKDTGNWDLECDDASKALENAYSQQKYDVCDLLIKEGLQLMMKNLPSIIYKTPLNTAQKAIKHLKDTENWDPKCHVASEALDTAFSNQKFDVCKLLIRDGVSLTMKNLPGIINVSTVSSENIARAIENLQDAGNWDAQCDDASEAFEKSFCNQMFDGCEVLIDDWGLPTVNNLPNILLETIERAVQYLKDTGKWDPKCNDASEALEKAFCHQRVDVCELLIHDGVSLTMKNLPGVINVSKISLETIKKAIQHLKDNESWKPKCNDASEALEKAFCHQRFDVCELLIHDGVSLTMKNLLGVINVSKISLETIKKAIQHLKDTENWKPKCNDAFEALEKAFCHQRFDVCDLLIHDGVSPTMKNLPGLINASEVSLETIERAIQNLQDAGKWNSKCDDATKALENAYLEHKSDVCDVLIRKEVSLTMKNFPGVVAEFQGSLEVAKNIIQHFKDTGRWCPSCSDASEALDNAYRLSNCYVCDLLIQEGVLPTIKTLPWWSLESVTKAVQYLKGTVDWDPKCDDVSRALETAYRQGKYDVCDLLIQEGVSLTMNTFPWWSLKSATKAIQFLKATASWDHKHDKIARALINAYTGQNYDVCHLLIQEGVSLNVKTLQWWSLENVTQAIRFLKGTRNWDPMCDDVSRSLENAFIGQNYDVCELLINEGASLTMEICSTFHCHDSIGSSKTLIKCLKATNHWDPSSEDAESLLARAKDFGRKDICQVLIEEGVCDPDAKD